MRLVNLTALYAALDVHRSCHGLSWRDAARATGLSPSTFSRLHAGRGIDLDAYATCCHWLGMSLDTFTATPSPITKTGTLGNDLTSLFRRHGVPEVYWRSLTDHIKQLIRQAAPRA